LKPPIASAAVFVTALMRQTTVAPRYEAAALHGASENGDWLDPCLSPFSWAGWPR
jgi:hypothetical protein